MDVNKMSRTDMRQTYTADQIADILGVSPRKAYEFCETTTDFRVLRIHKGSFDQWFNGSGNAF